MAEYRYQRIDPILFFLTTPQTQYPEFFSTIVDQSIEIVKNTYTPFIVEKYNRKTQKYTRIAWVIFNKKAKQMEVVFDPSNVLPKFLKNIIEDLNKETY